jgi:hypothetical protein
MLTILTGLVCGERNSVCIGIIQSSFLNIAYYKPMNNTEYISDLIAT